MGRPKMIQGETVSIATDESDRSIVLPSVPCNELEILSVLGSGGFGCVHYGMYGALEVAVKRTHQRHSKQQSYSDSFMAEIRAATLHHENIVRVLGLCFEHPYLEELPLLVMEYAGDRNLQTLVEDPREVIDSRRRLSFATDITSALEFAHSKGVLHLDVKLLNVIISQDDQCKLADFGCSQNSPERKADTPTKSLMTGTFAYRAPELLRGKVATDRSDVYSLAICLWQMLTRERPYAREEHQVIVFSVVAFNQRPDLPESIAAGVDQSYSDLFQLAWNADPLKRPSAKEMLRSLQELQRDASG